MGGRNSGRKPKDELTLDPGIQAWERQALDTDKSFEAFRVYRDMGPDRTLAGAAKAMGKSDTYHRTLEDWSAHNGWRLRVSEWDSHQDRMDRKAALELAAKKTSQRIALADGLWMTAARVLGMWNNYLVQFNEQQLKIKEEGGQLEVPPLSPTELQRLAEAGIKLTQLLEGKPTEIGAQQHQITVYDRRREIQKIISDKQVRMAMRVVAEAVEKSGDPTVH